MSLPLEDSFTDVISKAMRGLGLDDEGLAAKSSVPVTALQKVLAGTYEDNVVNKISITLNLHAPSLHVLSKNDWHPAAAGVDGLAQFTTQFGDMTVNSYLIWDTSTKQAAAFDSGADARPMLEFIAEKNLKLETIFLTHTHPDHVADIASLRTAGIPLYVSAKEPFEGAEEFDAGREFAIGGLRVETKQTWGHSKGGITYIVRDGLRHPVAIVGDALFAGSMGGGMVSYTDALATNRRYILSLPESTILCSGHGPLTTVTEEKAHNPFFPEYKQAS